MTGRVDALFARFVGAVFYALAAAATLAASPADAGAPPSRGGPALVQIATGRSAQEAIKRYRAGRYVEARASARVALRANAREIAALSILGWSEYQLGRALPARRAFETMLRIAPRSADALIGLGWSSFKLGKLDRAERSFRRAQPFAVGDQRYVIADGLGWIAFVRGDFAEAMTQFEREKDARARGQLQHDGQLGPAWIAMMRGDFVKARAYFAEGRRAQPGYFRLYDGEGRLALLQGDYAAAAEHALQGLKLVRFNRGLFLLLNAALVEGGDAEKAVAVYSELVRTYPDVADYYNGLGWAEFRRGRMRAAEKQFLIALQIRNNYPWARFGLARAAARMHAPVADAWRLYRRGEYVKALTAFDRRLVTIGRTNPSVQSGRGWSLLALGRSEEAKAAFAAALGLDRNFDIARKGLAAAAQGYRTAYLLAWDHAEAKRYDVARRQFARARAAAPADERWRIVEGLAWVDYFEGKLDKAAAAFERVLERHPDAPLSRKGRGYIALDRKQYATAIKNLKVSFASNPKQVVTSYLLPADRMNNAGRYRDALLILEAGARTHNQGPGILFQLARAYTGLGQTRRAVILARRAVGDGPVLIHPVLKKLVLPKKALVDIYLRLAWGLFYARHNKGALKRFEDYIAAGGSDIDAIRGRGFALYRLKRYREAIPDLERAAAAEPASLQPIREVVPIPGTGRSWPIRYSARSTLAWTYFRMKNYEMAAKTFRQVLKTHPAWIDALTGLGYSLREMGDKKGALRRFRAALLFSPGYPDAWQGIKSLGVTL